MDHAVRSKAKTRICESEKKLQRTFFVVIGNIFAHAKVLHLQKHLENDSSGLLCLVHWPYASLWHIPLFPNFALTFFILYFLL